jgi:hypothetical protein
MTKTVMIEEAEFQHLIKEIDNFKRAMIELEKRKGNPDYIECVCANMLMSPDQNARLPYVSNVIIIPV